VLLIGSMDTKGMELSWVADRVRALGCDALILDCGIRGDSDLPVTYTAAQVASAAGTTLSELRLLERGDAVTQMAQGVKAITLLAAHNAEIDAALCLGGAGASIAIPAFQALPLGFPKLLVSPLASGTRTLEMYVGTTDVAVMHSVADIMGVNRITRVVFDEAASYMAGAARGYQERLSRGPDRQGLALTVAGTMNGNTTPAMSEVKRLLAERGIDLVAFHTNGVGGRAMEELVEAGSFDAVLDFTTTEVAAEVFGGPMSAGVHRMEAASRRGLPQVLVPGCVDFVTLGTFEEVSAAYPGRQVYRHDSALTLLRLSADEMRAVATKFAEKVRLAHGPVCVIIPTGGLSMPNHLGGPFWDPEADAAFVETLLAGLPASVPTELIDCHINDPEFARRVVATLLELIPTVGESSQARQAEALT